MKHFVTALILIAVTVFAIITNAFFIVNKMGDFCDSFYELPTDQNDFGTGEKAAKIVAQIRDCWESQSLILNLSIPADEVSAVTLLLSDLEMFCRQSDFDMYQITLQRILVMLDDLRESEKPVLKSLI